MVAIFYWIVGHREKLQRGVLMRAALSDILEALRSCVHMLWVMFMAPKVQED